MSFAAKTDYYSLAGNGLVIVESNDGRTASVATAANEKGDIIASTMYGDNLNPTCSYALSADATLSTIKLG